MAEGPGGDRTEAPTAQRLQKARADGQVALSRDAVTLAMLCAGGAAVALCWDRGAGPLVRGSVAVMSLAGRRTLDDGALGAAFRTLFADAAVAIAPVLLAAMAGAVVATLLQTGFILRPAGLAPNLGRISPLHGVRRLFDPTVLVQALLSVLKILCFGLVLERVLAGSWTTLARLPDLALSAQVAVALSLLLRALAGLLGAQFVLAAVDVAWTRYRHHTRLRMSRQEIRDEHKENDGNPHVKARLRALRRQRARRNMMRAVPKATVVLTNPTHYAVALVYEQGSRSAPRVIAKGADEVAARIRAVAREHRVPVVENKPLARALFTVPIDSEIPREHFQAVAAVIAYVWRLAGHAKARTATQPPRRPL